MSYHADIYFIVKSRSKALALLLMDHFLPEREEMADCYELPRFGAETVNEFDSAHKLMEYLEENESEHHCVYWRNVNPLSIIKNGMIFYTPDQYLILGISIMANDQNEDAMFLQMSKFLKSKDGYITYESPPGNNYEEFMASVKTT